MDNGNNHERNIIGKSGRGWGVWEREVKDAF